MSERYPVTPAVRVLRAGGVAYTEHLFDYSRYPGALGGAEALGVDPHQVIKTLVMTTNDARGLLVLMHGDRETSTKAVARELDVKSVTPAGEREARRWTGYEFGGTSPFGTRERLPILVEQTIAALDRVYINGGKRGFLVGLTTDDLVLLLEPRIVEVAVPPIGGQ